MTTGVEPKTSVGPGLAAWQLSPLRFAWRCIRLPLVALLGLLEPLVRMLLTLAAILSVLTALFFETVSRLPTHSLLALLGFAAICGLVLAAYQGILRLLTR